MLGPDTTYIHCTTLNDTEIQMIVDTGGTVSLAAPVEMMMGHGMPPIQKFLDRGLKPEPQRRRRDQRPRATCSTRCDRCSPCSASFAAAEGKAPITARDVLAYATIEGARANGLDAKVGSLTPGKQADIIMLRTDRMNVTPLDDPATAVVTSMDTGNVDTVLIAGRVMKRGGQLLHVDWPAVKRLAAESRDFVIAKSGFKLPEHLSSVRPYGLGGAPCSLSSGRCSAASPLPPCSARSSTTDTTSTTNVAPTIRAGGQPRPTAARTSKAMIAIAR